MRPVRRETLEQRILEEQTEVEMEGWEKMVEEEESAMAKGFKLEVSIEEEAIAELREIEVEGEEGKGFRTVGEIRIRRAE